MFESFMTFVPVEWRGAFALLSAPIAWVPSWHLAIVDFAWHGEGVAAVLSKRVFLLLPVLLLVVAVWSTMASLYTLPFRSRRGGFVTALLMAWWETGRSIWLFWAGFGRLGVVLVGWLWGALRLGLRIVGGAAKGVVQSPLVLLDWTTRSYFKPGVPWIAFLALLVWCAVESTIFMYTLSPTLNEVLAGITGFEPNPYVMAPVLWAFLFFLVLGSFACIQVLGEAIERRRVSGIIQMLFVEFFVMFFEVIFLYRELVDAVTPWIAQQTSEAIQLGIGSTLVLASFGWIGVRGMTWFLFGRFGTPAVISVLARETITRDQPGVPAPLPAQTDFLGDAVAALKAESRWFEAEALRLFELVSLPVLQLLAPAVNFVVVVVLSRPIFNLPFKNLSQVMAATPKWARIGDAAPVVSGEPAMAATGGGE